MKKAIVCIFICMLVLLSSVISITGTIYVEEYSPPVTKEYHQDNSLERICNNLKIQLDNVITKQDALALVKKTISELKEHDLIPKGISEKQAQQLVTKCFSKAEFVPWIQKNNENETGNSNCLVIGIANETFFRPFPTIYDIPIIHYLAFNTSFLNYFNFIIWCYALRAIQPIKIGPYMWAGSRYTLVENGNITYESSEASSGWIWTLGANGVKKWNGTFYGGIQTRYRKSAINSSNYAETWNPMGIRGFIGINFLSSIEFLMDSNKPTFFIGFAREINFTYTPPWT